MGHLKITLDKGYSGRTERQRQTLRGLGLKKRHMTVVREDSPAIRGMVEKVSHLVTVEEVTQ